MSGKNAKLLRRLASTDAAPERILKRGWLATSHKGRGQARAVVERVLGQSKPKK